MEQYTNQQTKKMLLVFLIFVLVASFVFFVLNFAFVKISVSEPNAQLTRISSKDQQPKKIKSKFAIYKTGNYVFEAKNNFQISKKNIHVRPLWFNKVSLNPSPQLSTIKVSSDTKACLFGSKDQILSKTVYSYDCDQVSDVIISKNDEVASKLTRKFFVQQPVRFQDGFVGIDKSITDVDSDANSMHVVYATAQKYSFINFVDVPVNTDVLLSANEKSVFVVDPYQKKVFTAGSFNNTSSNQSKSIDLADIQDCTPIKSSASNKFLYVFCLENKDNINKTPSDSLEVGRGELFIYDIESNFSMKKVDIKDSNTSRAMLDFQVLDDNLIAAKYTNEATYYKIFDIKNSKLREKYRIDRASSVAFYKDKIYYSGTDGSVYYYDQNSFEQYAVFSSSLTKVDDIQESTAGILIRGSTDKQDSYSMVLLLGDTSLKNSQRIEDVLPYGYRVDNRLSFVIDYVDNKIIVDIPPSTLDYVSREEIQQKTQEYLKNSGFDISGYFIEYRG